MQAHQKKKNFYEKQKNLETLKKIAGVIQYY